MPENMIYVRSSSMTEEFEVSSQQPVPEVPRGGAKVKVHFAGACYTDKQILNSGQKRLKNPGIQDTSLFTGTWDKDIHGNDIFNSRYEVSGVVEEICNTVSECKFKKGDRVIVYPDTEELAEIGYAEYIIVHDVNNLIRVPDSLNLEVAALLPSGALRAYTAIMRAKPFVKEKIKEADRLINILIVGAGGLGLWTIKMAKRFIEADSKHMHVTVADTCIEKLMIAKHEGCFDVIHWNDSIHEEYILERTKDVCQGGVDVIIDFVSSPRTINRGMKVLREGGVIVVGGNAKYDVSISLNDLAERNQSILGVKRGTHEQLEQLVNVVANKEISPPLYTVFPVEEANKVFEQLKNSKINGRAVLKVGNSTISSS